MFQKQSLYQHSKTPKFLKEESASQKPPEDEEAENQSIAKSRPSREDYQKVGEGESPSRQQ